MFAKNKVSQSMLDAVNSVLVEDEKKRLIKDDEIDETGFHMAAHAAKKDGKTHFEFQGKKYPVTAKSHKEAMEMDEASLKIPTATGTKVLGGSGYGSKKAHDAQHKNPFEKGPSKKDLKDVKAPSKKELKSIGEEEMHHDDEKEDKALVKKMVKKSALKGEEIKEDGDCVTPMQAKNIADKEVGKHEKGMHKGKKGTVEEGTFASRLLKHIKEDKASAKNLETFTDNNMGEEKAKNPYAIGMAAAEKATGDTPPLKKSTIVKAHDIAKKIMKKEDVELDEDAPKKNQDVADKSWYKDAGKKPGPLHNVGKGMAAFLKGKKEPMESVEYELSEKNDSHTHAAHYENEKGEWTGMNLFTAKDDDDAIKQAQAKCKEGCRLSKVERHTTVKEAVDIETDKGAHKITTDMLRGRVPGGKLNSFKSYKVNLTVAGEEDIPKEVDQGEDTKEKQKITTNPGAVDIKFDDKLTTPPHHYFSKDKQLKNEEVEVLDENKLLDMYLLSKGINPKFISTDTKISHSKSNAFKSWMQTHQRESVEVPFNKPYKKTSDDSTVSASMKRARKIARAAMEKVKKQKDETMMGKISN